MSIERFESGKRMSQAVVHNGVVYLAGQVGEPGADVRQQTQQALTEIDRLLALSGSSKSRVLTAQIWLSNIADFPTMNDVWEGWIAPGNAPTRATAELKLASPEYLVEIIVTAAVADV